MAFKTGEKYRRPDPECGCEFAAGTLEFCKVRAGPATFGNELCVVGNKTANHASE
jgi:hypothetical protein